MKIYNIILAGGVGSRLEPLSTPENPKQFVVKIDGYTLYENTVKRVASPNKTTLSFIQAQFMSRSKTPSIYQPEMKETAPAILKCCLDVLEIDGHKDDVVCFFPSDHVIKSDSFEKDINTAILNSMTDDCIWLFGIKPTEPNTGYGYIQSERESKYVLDFREKPNENLAQDLINNYGYIWNSGIFCGKIQTFIDLIKQYCPNLYREQTEEDLYSTEALSFDREVLQKAKDRVKCHTVDWYWNDVGTWDKLSKEVQGNVIYTEKKSYVDTNVKDIILIESENYIHVKHKSTVFPRPWGEYEILNDTETFKVKKLRINPGQSISLQSHNLRNEHWIVLQGIATVYIQDDVLTLRKDQSTYIPATFKHKLENRTSEVVEIIEVQTGSYFGEDDIHRYSDIYGRV